MAGDERPTPSSAAVVSCPVAESIPSPPPQDPVGSPSRDMPEIQSLTSEDDHDHGNRENHDHAHEHAVRAAVLLEDLKHRIIKQVNSASSIILTLLRPSYLTLEFLCFVRSGMRFFWFSICIRRADTSVRNLLVLYALKLLWFRSLVRIWELVCESVYRRGHIFYFLYVTFVDIRT